MEHKEQKAKDADFEIKTVGYGIAVMMILFFMAAII